MPIEGLCCAAETARKAPGRLVAAVPAIVLFLVPCAAAVWYGNKARAEGNHAALLPMVLRVVVGLWMLVMNTVSLIAG